MSRRILQLKINKEAFESYYQELKLRVISFEENIKVYIDTNIFGRGIDARIKPDEAAALKRIKSKEKIEFYTSEKTRKEILNHPKKQASDYLEFIIGLGKVIPEENFLNVSSGAIGTAPLGTNPIGAGGTTEDKILVKLKSLFSEDDAEQIFQAIKSEANYFLTLDQTTILSKRAEYNKFDFKTRLVSPKNLANILFVFEDNLS